jgi:hypothetical protein
VVSRAVVDECRRRRIVAGHERPTMWRDPRHGRPQRPTDPASPRAMLRALIDGQRDAAARRVAKVSHARRSPCDARRCAAGSGPITQRSFGSSSPTSSNSRRRSSSSTSEPTE